MIFLDPNDPYWRAPEEFRASLERASSGAKPGRGLSRDEGIRRIVEQYGDPLKEIRDTEEEL